MRWRWAVVGSLMALQGCQTAAPTVFAMIENGEIVFHVRDRGIIERIFGWDDARHPIDGLWVTRSKRTVVGFEPARSRPEVCSRRETFPLRLGERRCGFEWHGRRADLRTGLAYVIRLRSHQDLSKDYCSGNAAAGECRYDEWWSDGIVGAFKIRGDGRIVNLRPSEFPDECGADHAQQGAVQEEWADHCLTQTQREGIKEERGPPENGAGR